MKSSHNSDYRKEFKKKITSSVILALWGCDLLLSVPALAAPQGGVVTSGAATISQSGNVTNVNQSTNKASINWQSFSTKPTETVNFNQPGVSAITLNRVIGNEKSVLEGALNANGMVFLINSNGVLFGKNSSVNTAGFLAGTLDITDEDFNAGNYVFKANGSPGSVINLGTITAKDGYVALLGNSASNQGVITATKGTVALAGGDKITLNFNGDSLVSVTVDEGTLNGLVENKQAIYADGGTVIMTAKAADDLLSAQVNNRGLIQARTIDDLKGEINIHAYGGTANVDGTLDASAPMSGDGGFIETSGDKVKIADSAVITTASANGKNGTWLIDPDGFTIGAGGDISGSLLGTLLGYNNITLSSTDGSGSDGDINVNQAVCWSADTILTLNATNDININKPITAAGTNAGLLLNYGGNYHILTPASYSGAILDANGNPVANQAPAGTEYASVTLSGSNAGLKINGNTYTLIHSVSALDLLDGYDSVSGTGTASTVSGYYALAQDLDASGTAYTSALIGTLSGTLAGLGHKISGLTISASSTYSVGLIGTAPDTTTIRDIGLADVNIAGAAMVGALLGSSNADLTITHAYSTGAVSGAGSTGGLVGYAFALSGTTTVTDSYSEANVTSSANSAAGLIGYLNSNSVTLSNCHATGNVTGTMEVGGLAGFVGGKYVTVSNSYYATGNVTASNEKAGGLIGKTYARSNSSSLLVTNSFATGDVTGKNSVGGLIGAAETASWGVKSVVTNVNNSYATGNVTSTGGDNAGGLIGYAMWTNISNSHATGNVTATGTGFVNNMGGLVGRLDNGSITDSYATGDVSGIWGNYDFYVGGLVGFMNGIISNSYATGNVSGYEGVGGLVGWGGAIDHSWASGNVSGTNVVGGLAGAAGSIANSHATGNVTGTTVVTNDGLTHVATQTGGLAGFVGTTIANSYATGNVTGVDQVGGLVAGLGDGNSIIDSYASGHVTGNTNVGGLAGRAGGWAGYGGITISNSYWNADNTGNIGAIGTTQSGGAVALTNVRGLSSAQFKDVQYYLDGTIDQVLAGRAAAAAYQAAATSQAGQTVAQAHQNQADQPILSIRVVEKHQPSIDDHIVYGDSADYSADIKSIDADGVQFDLEDESHDKKK